MSDDEFEKDLEQRFPQFSMGLRDAMTRIPQWCDDCTSNLATALGRESIRRGESDNVILLPFSPELPARARPRIARLASRSSWRDSSGGSVATTIVHDSCGFAPKSTQIRRGPLMNRPWICPA
jgi:hypothetical protein